MPLLYENILNIIINCFYNVYNTLGYGFLEKVYENALKLELEKQGLIIQQQKPLKVFYDNFIVGEYYADIVVDDKIILELKSNKTIIKIHETQLFNYLKATSIKVGYILNFGKKAEFKRIIY